MNRLYAVSLTDNEDDKARDQISDIGKSYGECKKVAELYCQTSRYLKIAVIELHSKVLLDVKGITK